jgi:hypothetical protein
MAGRCEHYETAQGEECGYLRARTGHPFSRALLQSYRWFNRTGKWVAGMRSQMSASPDYR